MYKTTDAANHWEKIPTLDYTSFLYPGYYKDINVLGNQLWFGMGIYLAINTNIDAPTLPTAIFSIDTAELYHTGIVKLQNYSKTNYTYQWFVNNTLVSTDYNTSYSRINPTKTIDTIMLVVNNGSLTDTMIQMPVLYAKSSICPNGNISFTSYLSGSNYQWQINTGNGFNNIANDTNYTGTNLQTIFLTNVPSGWNNYQYRCMVNGINTTNIYTLGISNTWENAGSNTWENPSAWSCGKLPDANTDVIINSYGVVVINGNAVCRSITVSPNGSVLINTGATLTVTH